MNMEKELLIEVYADMLIVYSFLGTRGIMLGTFYASN